MTVPTNQLVVVTVSDDAMTASLALAACAPDEAPSLEACLDAVRAHEIVMDDEVRAAVGALVAAHASDAATARDGVIAAGAAPVHGADGAFTLAPEFVPEPVQPSDDEAVDFYNATPFIVVREGQSLGRISPPTPGKNGRTVTGAPAPARDGAPCQFECDATVELRGDLVVACVDGALEIDGARVRVRQSLEISGGVDYATGNIRFPGDVIVGDGVRDCFDVDAGRDLIVNGVVEAASIAAGRDVLLVGGMAGREKGTLTVGRDLSARYLGMVTGVVGRDASVEREVVDCDLEIRGGFQGERCVVVGGRLAVRGVAQIGEVGREAGARTEIVLGRSPRVDLLASEAHALLARIDEASVEACSLRQRLGEAVNRLRERITPVAGLQLTVQRRIHAGAVVVAGASELHFTSDVPGPVRLTLDLGGRPRVVSIASGQPLEIGSIGRLQALEASPTNRSDAA